MVNKRLKETIYEETEQSLSMTKEDFFGIVLNREKMKQQKLDHILLAEQFKILVHTIKNKFCSYTKNKHKSSLAERYEKFNMATFLVLSDGADGIVIKKVVSDSQKQQHIELKRKELREILAFENTVPITIDFNEESTADGKIDILTNKIKNAWKEYLKSLAEFCDEDDKKTQMHIEKMKNRLETPGKISIQREWLVGFLKITSYQFGGKIHK